MYGRGNIKRKKTVNFKKNKKASKKENICEREDEERQNVEPDEFCSDHEPGATIDEEPDSKRLQQKET